MKQRLPSASKVDLKQPDRSQSELISYDKQDYSVSLSGAGQVHQVKLTGKSSMVQPAPSSSNLFSKLTPIEELAYQVQTAHSKGAKRLQSFINGKPRRVHEDGFAMLERKYQERDAQMKL